MTITVTDTEVILDTAPPWYRPTIRAGQIAFPLLLFFSGATCIINPAWIFGLGYDTAPKIFGYFLTASIIVLGHIIVLPFNVRQTRFIFDRNTRYLSIKDSRPFKNTTRNVAISRSRLEIESEPFGKNIYRQTLSLTGAHSPILLQSQLSNTPDALHPDLAKTIETLTQSIPSLSPSRKQNPLQQKEPPESLSQKT